MGNEHIPFTGDVARSLIKSVESPDLWDKVGKIPQLDGEQTSLSEADINKARELYQQDSVMLKAIDQISTQYFKPPSVPSSTSSPSPSWSDTASAFYQGSGLAPMGLAPMGLADNWEDTKAAGGALISHYASPILEGAIQVFIKPSVDVTGVQTRQLETNPVTIAFNAAEVVSSGHSVSGAASYVLGGPGAAAEAVITRYDKKMEQTGNYLPVLTSKNYQGALALNLVDNIATKVVGGAGAIAGAALFVTGAVPEAIGHEVLHTADEVWNSAMTGSPVDLNYNPFPDVYGYDDAAGLVHGVKSLVELAWTAPLVVAEANMISFDQNMKDVKKAVAEIAKLETSTTSTTSTTSAKEAASIIFETQKTTSQRTFDAGKEAFWERMGNADKNVLGDDPTQTVGVRATRVLGTVGAVVVTAKVGGKLAGATKVNKISNVAKVSSGDGALEVTEAINRAPYFPMENTFPQLFKKFMGRDDLTEVGPMNREVTQRPRSVKPPSEGTAPGANARIRVDAPKYPELKAARPLPSSAIDFFPKQDVDALLETIAKQAASFEADTRAALQQLDEAANTAFTSDATPGAEAAK